MTGRTLDSDVDTVTARATFEYLPGGFLVAKRFKADFVGMPIESLEIIDHDPGSGTFPSTVYANMVATPLSYRRELDGDELTVTTEELGATFRVAGAASRSRAAGAPTPVGKAPGNVQYDVAVHRTTSA